MPYLMQPGNNGMPFLDLEQGAHARMLGGLLAGPWRR